jgi:hypothetical protein
MVASINRSFGPPIITRCSTLSRRSSTRRRRLSTSKLSMTASRERLPLCGAPLTTTVRRDNMRLITQYRIAANTRMATSKSAA